MKTFVIYIFLFANFAFFASASDPIPNPDRPPTDANVFGHVTSRGEHIPFISVMIEGTTIGTSTDATGHFMLLNLPPGKHVLKARGIGYRSQETEIVLESGKTVEVNFYLEPDVLELEQLVVSASLSDIDRWETPVNISVITPRLLESVQAMNLAEGLNFVPGLRVEVGCINCGFTQLRMNGLDGAYSQILINSQPIFSSLASVYGLELLPANMIERVEVIRGGGSALFGGNAIAGTVNIITRDPLSNTFQLQMNQGYTYGQTPDQAINLNTSLITDDLKTGAFLFGSLRNRQAWDANNDRLSEITGKQGNAFGLRAFHKPGTYSRLSLDLSSLNEFRRGGSMTDDLPHLTEITEQTRHEILTGGLRWEHFLPESASKYSVYFSAQQVYRDSYYGAGFNPDGYGYTEQHMWLGGVQYAREFDRVIVGPSSFTTGVEWQNSTLTDEKFSAFDARRLLVLSQDVTNIGVYAQNQWTLGRYRVLLGVRTDKNSLMEELVVSPRGNIMADLSDNWQIRFSYARGFRAPQIFDEDLHIGVAGAQAIRTVRDENLMVETSHSLTGSTSYTGFLGNADLFFTAEGFYTHLLNAFVTHLEIDEEGNAVHFKTNGSGARVGGVNLETQLAFDRRNQMQLGFTLQQALYDEDEIVWEPISGAADSLVTTQRMLRSPDFYGYLTFMSGIAKGLDASLTSTITGPMTIPHMIVPATGYSVLRKTPWFFDASLRVTYMVRATKETGVRFHAGVQNIFNSFQQDFDTGLYRDGGFVYGPSRPRSFFIGITFGNDF